VAQETSEESGRGRARILAVLDDVRTSFGFPSAIGIGVAVLAGLLLPSADDALGLEVPVLSFDSQASARSLLETIGTATTAVAGLSFSVTVVALTLASQQLSPRVLRSFRGDRLSQVTLALLLGTFVYSLTLLVRLGVSGEDAEPPHLSITLAVILALVSFATFAAFIAHIIDLLQPSSVIASVRRDATGLSREPFPAGPGEPEDATAAGEAAEQKLGRISLAEIDSEKNGYLTFIDVPALIDCATGHDAIIVQSVYVGAYVLPGQSIAEVGLLDGDDDATKHSAIASSIRSAFVIGDQRTLMQDIAFPVRQLADIVLKGLSPGINDPTTAENAIDALGAVLTEFVRSERPSSVRVDGSGAPRFVARAPGIDDLVHLGFEQVRSAARRDGVFHQRMTAVLDHLEREARRCGLSSREISRQRRLADEQSCS
jgi:uncharacterized membrane protein